MLKGALLPAALALLALAPRLPRLGQRYDRQALTPITGQPAPAAADARLQERLAAWVTDGAGSGATWLPWSRPRVPRPFACLRVAASAANPVHHFGYRLAGYHQLDERSRVGGLGYRLGVQLRPLAWFLPRRADEPWDDAWLCEVDEARLAALARWRPRRPTLIVLAPPAAADAAHLSAMLAHAARHGEHPVRLLILEDQAAPQAGHPATAPSPGASMSA